MVILSETCGGWTNESGERHSISIMNFGNLLDGMNEIPRSSEDQVGKWYRLGSVKPQQ